MKKYFCDCCGREQAVGSGIMPTAVVKDAKGVPLVTVHMALGQIKTNDSFDICVYCVLDAVRALDDRPNAA